MHSGICGKKRNKKDTVPLYWVFCKQLLVRLMSEARVRELINLF